MADQRGSGLLNVYQSRMGLRPLLSGVGIAPFGIGHSGERVKGKGFFGPLPSQQDGYSLLPNFSTEISTEDDFGEYPLMVPTLSADELDLLLKGSDPTDAIYDKAFEHAKMRRSKGLSPFAGTGEAAYPVPLRGLLDVPTAK